MLNMFSLIFFLGSFLTFGFSQKSKVFDFGKSSEIGFSSVSLENIPDAVLPDHFIICSSHSQNIVGSRSTEAIYVIYRDKDLTKPWLSVGLFNDEIWINIGFEYWYTPPRSVPEKFWLKWMHICVDIDTKSRTIEVGINGQSLGKSLNISGLIHTPKLNLQLGIVEHSFVKKKYQFDGKISNIHLIDPNKTMSVTTLSEMPCMLNKSSCLICWSEMHWKKINVKETFERTESICAKNSYILFGVPYQWTTTEARIICSKFGKGQIAGVVDSDHPVSTNFENYYGFYEDEDCFYFPTSYVYYGAAEGKVVNVYNDEKIDVLWGQGFPQEKDDAFDVVFYPPGGFFENTDNYFKKRCLLCNSSREIIYSTRGICQNSYLGNA